MPAPGVLLVEEALRHLAQEDGGEFAKVDSTILVYIKNLADHMGDDERQRLLKPYLAAALNTQADYPYADPQRDEKLMEHRDHRALLCADAAIRAFAPLALERAGETQVAASLRALDPVDSTRSARKARKRIKRLFDANNSAAGQDALGAMLYSMHAGPSLTADKAGKVFSVLNCAGRCAALSENLEDPEGSPSGSAQSLATTAADLVRLGADWSKGDDRERVWDLSLALLEALVAVYPGQAKAS